MVKPARIIVLSELLLLASLELLILKGAWFYSFLGLINLIIFWAIWRMSRHSVEAKKGWLLFWSWPFIFFNGLIASLIIIPSDYFISQTLIQLIILAGLLAWFSYLRAIYYFWHAKEEVDSWELSRIWLPLSTLAVFVLGSALYGLQLFWDLSYWVLALILLAAVALLSWQGLRVFKKNILADGLIIFVLALIILEVFWALYFLPFAYPALALFLALAYYFLFNLLVMLWQNTWNPKNIRFLITFSTILFIILLLLISWR